MKTRYFISIVLIALSILVGCSKDKEEINFPNCEILQPNNGQHIAKGETVIIYVKAESLNGSISEVSFAVDDIERGLIGNAPYIFLWKTSNESVELHTLKATSIDNNGNGTTDEVSINIVDGVYPTGTVTDSRDGQSYNTIEYGSQTWTVENINYEMPNSWWAGNDSIYGEVFGRLYEWDAALSACPTGWHLPSDDEWKILEMYVGMSQSQADSTGYRGVEEGKKLKTTSNWVKYLGIGWNGTNSFGFNGTPAGYGYNGNGLTSFKGILGRWWTATPSTSEIDKVMSRQLFNISDKVARHHSSPSYDYSVRCVKD